MAILIIILLFNFRAFFGIVICVAAVATFRDTRQREQHLREKGTSLDTHVFSLGGQEE
jgi:hypothetical protein